MEEEVQEVVKPPKTPCPEFDYLNWPYKSHKGVVNAMNRLMTQAIFYEPHFYKNKPGREEHCLYTMADREVYVHEWDTWIPCARQIYVQSGSEYDAMRKLVGSSRQWELLKNCKWFVNGIFGYPGLTSWMEEQNERKASVAESILMKEAMAGNVTAAKLLFEKYASKRPVGRPTKERMDKEKDMGSVDDDFERVVSIVR